MATDIDQLVFIKNLIGAEDLFLGYKSEQQIRDGDLVGITAINAHTIPYKKPTGEETTIGDLLDDLYNAVLKAQ